MLWEVVQSQSSTPEASPRARALISVRTSSLLRSQLLTFKKELYIQVGPDWSLPLIVLYGMRPARATFQNHVNPAPPSTGHNVRHTSWKSSVSAIFSPPLSLSNFFMTSDTTHTEDVSPTRNSRSARRGQCVNQSMNHVKHAHSKHNTCLSEMAIKHTNKKCFVHVNKNFTLQIIFSLTI